MEVLGIIATLVTGYDITLKDGSPLKMPEPKKQGFGVQVKHPAHDVSVIMKRRKEFDGFRWVYNVGSVESADTKEMSFNN